MPPETSVGLPGGGDPIPSRPDLQDLVYTEAPDHPPYSDAYTWEPVGDPIPSRAAVQTVDVDRELADVLESEGRLQMETGALRSQIAGLRAWVRERDRLLEQARRWAVELEQQTARVAALHHTEWALCAYCGEDWPCHTADALGLS